MFEDDGTARTKLLSHLGFSVPVEKEDTTQNEISEQISALGIGESLAGKEGDSVKKDTMMQLIDNGEDFFNNLPSPKTDTPVSTKSASNFATNEAALGWEEAPLATNGADECDASFDDAVQRVLVVGDYKSAVELCISANKMADALVIAHVGGTSLWESTRDQYLKTSRSSYLKVVITFSCHIVILFMLVSNIFKCQVVSAMVNNDLKSLVSTRPLKSWKETLALFCTVSPPLPSPHKTTQKK